MQYWFGRLALRLGGRHRKAQITALLAALTSVGVVFAPIGVVAASAATSVSNVSAAVSPTTAGAGTATYTVHFTTSSSGSLAGGNGITLTAPDGTSFPSYPSGYAISATGGSVPVGAVTTAQVVGPGSTTTSTTYNQAVITLGGSNSTTPVGNNDAVTVSIHPTGNPIQASTTDHLTVSTSADATAAQSGAYTITPGPAASFISPQGDNQSTPTNSAFSKQLGVTVVDAYGNPVPGAPVTFTAPASSVTQPTASGTFDHMSSSPCPTSPSNPPPSNVCVVTADATGKATASALTADGTAGSYIVTATSPGVPTYSFNLTNCAGSCPPPPTQVSPGSVTVAPATAGATGATYTISFTTATSLPVTGGTIKFVAPNGTGFSSVVPDYSITVNNGHVATVTGVSAVSTSGSATANQVVISLDLSTIGAGDLVTVTVTKSSSSGSGMTNPTVAGYSYQIQESTSTDTQPGVYTSAYSIAAANPASVSIVSGDSQSTLIDNPFAYPLVAAVKDRYGNSVGGAQVTFTAPSSGASAAWTNGTTVETDTTTSTGQAESSVPVANSMAGGPYPVHAAANAGFSASEATFNLINVAQAVNPSVPNLTSSTAGDKGVGYSLTFTTSSTGALGSGATITAVAPAGTDFTSSTASDYTIAVSGGHTAVVGHVTPSSAGGSSTNNEVLIVLNSSSIAAGDTVTVNISGVTNPTVASSSYSITEFTSSDSVSAATPDYSITAADPVSVSVVSGSDQSANIGQQFASPLVALVQDRYGNPVAGAQVIFSAPATGPSAIFAGNSTSEIDATGPNGLATSSIPVANGSGGTYSISATDAAFNLTSNPAFTLTNTAPPPEPPVNVAFEANTGALWTWVGSPDTSGSATYTTYLGMAAGSSPSVTSLGNGQVAVAFEANTGALWTWVGVPGTTGYGASAGVAGFMLAGGSSPSINSLGNGQTAVAFQEKNTGSLWTWSGPPGTAGFAASAGLGMAAGTSPTIH
jgi:hypothetical protein